SVVGFWSPVIGSGTCVMSVMARNFMRALLSMQQRVAGASRRPYWLVVAEGHRGPGPMRRRLGEAHHRHEMVQPTGRRVARHRPALQLRGGEFLRHVLEFGLRHLAASD